MMYQIFLYPPKSPLKSRMVSYKQRKTKTGFQTLSPCGREVWRGGKAMPQNEKSRLMYFSFFV
jgi:hypothetical protein